MKIFFQAYHSEDTNGNQEVSDTSVFYWQHNISSSQLSIDQKLFSIIRELSTSSDSGWTQHSPQDKEVNL